MVGDDQKNFDITKGKSVSFDENVSRHDRQRKILQIHSESLILFKFSVPDFQIGFSYGDRKNYDCLRYVSDKIFSSVKSYNFLVCNHRKPLEFEKKSDLNMRVEFFKEDSTENLSFGQRLKSSSLEDRSVQTWIRDETQKYSNFFRLKTRRFVL